MPDFQTGVKKQNHREDTRDPVGVRSRLGTRGGRAATGPAPSGTDRHGWSCRRSLNLLKTKFTSSHGDRYRTSDARRHLRAQLLRYTRHRWPRSRLSSAAFPQQPRVQLGPRGVDVHRAMRRLIVGSARVEIPGEDAQGGTASDTHPWRLRTPEEPPQDLPCVGDVTAMQRRCNGDVTVMYLPQDLTCVGGCLYVWGEAGDSGA